MARITKASKSSTESTSTQSVAPVPVPAPVSVSAPVAEVASAESKAKKVKKVKAEKAVAPVVESAAPVEPVVAASSEEAVVGEVDVPLAEQSIEFLAKLQQITQLMTSLKAEFRSLEKKWTRELKTAQKQSSRRKRKSGNRAPSGFVKPTRISDELASFLGKEKGTEMARTAVTRDINLYIRTHNLQDKANGRKIIPDDKLASLLKLEKSDELTYFNLQKYMSPHFAKTIKVVEATA